VTVLVFICLSKTDLRMLFGIDAVIRVRNSAR